MIAHAVVALLWLGFGAVHSLLAAEPVKARLDRVLGVRQRLAYNVVATLHLAAVLLLARWLLAGAPPHPDLPPAATAVQWAMIVLGGGVLWIAMRGYDAGRFLGTSQLRGEGDDADEPLQTGGIHRCVRHPLYLGSILVLWGLVDDAFTLSTALWGTLYFAIGLRFEERKLIRRYGDAYRDYRRRVPAVIPWKGCRLSS